MHASRHPMHLQITCDPVCLLLDEHRMIPIRDMATVGGEAQASTPGSWARAWAHAAGHGSWWPVECLRHLVLWCCAAARPWRCLSFVETSNLCALAINLCYCFGGQRLVSPQIHWNPNTGVNFSPRYISLITLLLLQQGAVRYEHWPSFCGG